MDERGLIICSLRGGGDALAFPSGLERPRARSYDILRETSFPGPKFILVVALSVDETRQKGLVLVPGRPLLCVLIFFLIFSLSLDKGSSSF